MSNEYEARVVRLVSEMPVIDLDRSGGRVTAVLANADGSLVETQQLIDAIRLVVREELAAGKPETAS